MDSGIMSWIVTVALIGFGIYELYHGIKQLIEHNHNRKEYMDNHNKSFDFFEEYKLWFAIYLAVAVISIVAGIYQMVVERDFIYALGFFVLSACGISFALDCLVKRRAWFYEEGFFYEKKYYRYKSIVSIKKTSRLRPGFNVSFAKDPAMVVTRKMAIELQKRQQEMKENKKKRK